MPRPAITPTRPLGLRLPIWREKVLFLAGYRIAPHLAERDRLDCLPCRHGSAAPILAPILEAACSSTLHRPSELYRPRPAHWRVARSPPARPRLTEAKNIRGIISRCSRRRGSSA